MRREPRRARAGHTWPPGQLLIPAHVREPRVTAPIIPISVCVCAPAPLTILVTQIGQHKPLLLLPSKCSTKSSEDQN